MFQKITPKLLLVLIKLQVLPKHQQNITKTLIRMFVMVSHTSAVNLTTHSIRNTRITSDELLYRFFSLSCLIVHCKSLDKCRQCFPIHAYSVRTYVCMYVCTHLIYVYFI